MLKKEIIEVLGNDWPWLSSTVTPTRETWACPPHGPNSPALDINTWKSTQTWMQATWDRSWSWVMWISGPASYPTSMWPSLNKKNILSPANVFIGLSVLLQTTHSTEALKSSIPPNLGLSHPSVSETKNRDWRRHECTLIKRQMSAIRPRFSCFPVSL